jgi:hypothetical protein
MLIGALEKERERERARARASHTCVYRYLFLSLSTHTCKICLSLSTHTCHIPYLYTHTHATYHIYLCTYTHLCGIPEIYLSLYTHIFLCVSRKKKSGIPLDTQVYGATVRSAAEGGGVGCWERVVGGAGSSASVFVLLYQYLCFCTSKASKLST